MGEALPNARIGIHLYNLKALGSHKSIGNELSSGWRETTVRQIKLFDVFEFRDDLRYGLGVNRIEEVVAQLKDAQFRTSLQTRVDVVVPPVVF